MKHHILSLTENTSLIPVFSASPSRHLLLNSVAASFLAFGSFAGEVPAPLPGSTESAVNLATGGPRSESLGRVGRARELIGMEIRNPQGERLGKVDDLVLDLESGRVLRVLVATGGILGLGESLRSLPPGGFYQEVSHRSLHLDLTSESMKALAVLDASDWKSCCESNRTSDRPETPGEVLPVQTAASRVSARAAGPSLQKATQVMGLKVVNAKDETLGNVENLVVDLSAGRIVAVVVSSGGFLGMGDELSAIPSAALRFHADGSSLRLDTTKEALAAAPHFKAGEWPDFGSSSYAAGVYGAYRVPPYFGTNPAPETVVSSPLTPLDQGTSVQDVATTAQIRRGILAGEGRSFNGRNVKIITADGHVTLRGPVNSEQERREIGDIALGIAQAGNVDNQLEVR